MVEERVVVIWLWVRNNLGTKCLYIDLLAEKKSFVLVTHMTLAIDVLA